MERQEVKTGEKEKKVRDNYEEAMVVVESA